MIIGIDLSTKDVALTSLLGNKGPIYHSQKINLGGSFENKILQTTAFIKIFCEEYLSSESSVFIESPKYQFANHLSDMLIGAITSIFLIHRAPVKLIVPLEWQTNLGIPYPKFPKTKAGEKAKVQWYHENFSTPLDLDPDNCDAYGIAVGGHNKYGTPKAT